MFLLSSPRKASSSSSSWKISRTRSKPMNLAGMALAALCATTTSSQLSTAAAVAAAATTTAEATAYDPSLNVQGIKQAEDSRTALLVALQDGLAGEQALRDWSAYAGRFGFGDQEEGEEEEKEGDERGEEEEEEESSSVATPSVWVLCKDTATAQLVDELPNVKPLLSTPVHPWAEALEDFVLQNEAATVYGLLGEGVLPHPDLGRAIQSLEPALAGSDAPTAVLTRSRLQNGDDGGVVATGIDFADGGAAASSSSGGGGGGGGEWVWLSDSFLSQVWVNANMLGLERLDEAGLEGIAVQDMPLLAVIPRLIEDPARIGTVLVDGTGVMGSIFAVGGGGGRGDEEQQHLLAAAATSDREPFRIGSAEFALVKTAGRRGGGGGGDHGVVEIATAPWPPLYVLETVANEDGLVIVNNVNCGYLDFAANFLRSVRRVSDAKVLWVAMDEVAFDFMDELAPGCAAMFPSEGSERHHAIGAGTMGDATFQSQVLVRPSILQSILAAGYIVLWTDSDVVWLGDPLPLLPDINDPSSAEVMLQHDGNAGNKCTCFMYLRPTDVAKELLVLWKQSILDSDAVEDQLAFRPALVHQQDAGMRLAIIPHDVFPAGKEFFDHPYVEDYTQTYHAETLIIHNNWIKGHAAKLTRFREYHLWGVEDVPFPQCSG